MRRLEWLPMDTYNILVDIPSWLKHPVAMWHWVRHNTTDDVEVHGHAGESLRALHCKCGAYYFHPHGTEHDGLTDQQRDVYKQAVDRGLIPSDAQRKADAEARTRLIHQQGHLILGDESTTH